MANHESPTVLKEILGDLDKNFMYRASLASKELFHSNIIGWLLGLKSKGGEMEVIKAFFKSFEINHGGIDLSVPQEFEVHRERWNMDLVIEFRLNESRTEFIVIENKVKSLVSKDQLEKYDDSLKSKGVKEKIVLRLIQHADVEVEALDWHVKSYEHHLMNFLSDLEAMQFDNGGIEEVVIIEYKKFIHQLLDICEHFGLRQNGYDFGMQRYNLYAKNDYKQLTSVKLHDLVAKVYHEKIAALISTNLRATQPDVSVEAGFTRTQGLNSIKLLIPKGKAVKIGVQLQGNRLKQFVESGSYETSINLARNLVKEKLWFWNGDLESALGDGYSSDEPGKFRIAPGGGDRNFCKYANKNNTHTFLYLYKWVSEIGVEDEVFPTINELVGSMIKMIEQVLHHEMEIAEMIEE